MLEQITGSRSPSRPADQVPLGIVVIAASLGGVAALGDLVGDLPADFPLPILICQHVRGGRCSLLPTILGRRTGLRVVTADDGDVPVAGSVYVAPSDRHLLVRADGRLGLWQGERVSFCRPSADVLFRSAAEHHGDRTIAVVLTGRGRDGAQGTREVRQRGGFAIAQDENSSEAFDMPLAARDIGQADLVLPLGRIPEALRMLAADHEDAMPAGDVLRAGASGHAPWDEAAPAVL